MLPNGIVRSETRGTGGTASGDVRPAGLVGFDIPVAPLGLGEIDLPGFYTPIAPLGLEYEGGRTISYLSQRHGERRERQQRALRIGLGSRNLSLTHSAPLERGDLSC